MEHTELYLGLLDAFEEIAMKENNMELKKAVEEQRKEDLIESVLPDVAEESIIEQEDVGISGMFIDALNDCWSAIDNYNSMIVTLDELDRHEFDDTLQMLLEERNKEVGALQAIVELLNGSGKEIEIGKSEAEDSIAFDVVGESMNEADEWPESINEGE